MNVLVAGGAGFLGSHLCDRLIAVGHKVLCVDNFYTGSKANVAHLLTNPRFELIRHDITLPLYVEVEQIYNLACPASPKQYQRNPVQTIKTCISGMINLLGLAKRTGARILQASTSEVYGDPRQHPQTEEYWGHVNPIGPRSCYDEGKRCAESLCVAYRDQYSVDVRMARIFNTYGPRMQPNDGRVISTFIMQALRHQPITIYGDGSTTRSFCYVSDLIDGLVRLMDSPLTSPVNLGNPEECSLLKLAKVIVDMTQSRSPFLYKEKPQDDPSHRQPDIAVARKHLGWEPKVSLRDGLQLTIQDLTRYR